MVAFLIRNLSDELRVALETDAATENIPIQEVVRQILCAHYELECPPPSGRYSRKREDVWEASRTILVRLHPQLWATLREDADLTGESMQRLVHEALEAHYQAAIT